VSAESVTVDGRVRRGAENRERIVSALVGLVREGALRPTAEQVAERAGVGTRTVFRHFEDMERLYAETSAQVQAELAPLLAQPAPTGSLPARVTELVSRRGQLYESIGPLRRSADTLRWRSKFLQADRTRTARHLRADLERALPEMARLSEAAAAALEQATSFEAWDRLRLDQRLGAERARAAMEVAVRALLGA
jgi:AcrR family transcriptional regulator